MSRLKVSKIDTTYAADDAFHTAPHLQNPGGSTSENITHHRSMTDLRHAHVQSDETQRGYVSSDNSTDSGSGSKSRSSMSNDDSGSGRGSYSSSVNSSLTSGYSASSSSGSLSSSMTTSSASTKQAKGSVTRQRGKLTAQQVTTSDPSYTAFDQGALAQFMTKNSKSSRSIVSLGSEEHSLSRPSFNEANEANERIVMQKMTTDSLVDMDSDMDRIQSVLFGTTSPTSEGVRGTEWVSSSDPDVKAVEGAVNYEWDAADGMFFMPSSPCAPAPSMWASEGYVASFDDALAINNAKALNTGTQQGVIGNNSTLKRRPLATQMDTCGPLYEQQALPAASASSSSVVPAGDEEFISQRRRRRLNQIVPCPRKPRTAEFTCSSCSEQYRTTVSDNPWWSVQRQDCPKCHASQIPRIDIIAPINSIEHDPNVQALFGEGVEDSGDEECDDGSDDEDMKEEDGTAAPVLDETVEPESERECFGGEGLFQHEEAAKLLILMCHARTCGGGHQHPEQANMCKSVKFLMLHIRDCSGSDLYGRNCLFPWCRAGKHLIDHLTHCYDPVGCVVCNPSTLPPAFSQLRQINFSRGITTANDYNSNLVGATALGN